jgi:hypothetical protein
MSNLKKIFIISFLLISLESCRWISGAGMPKYAFTMPPIPDGTPAFKKGWEDGCRNAMYARGNVLYRNLNKFKLDPNLIDNSEYMFGLRRSYGFCAFNISIDGPVGSSDNYIFGAYDDWFSAQNYNYTGFFTCPPATPFAPHDSMPGGLDAMMGVWSKKDGGTALSGNPLWAGGSKGQIFGQ